jgi:leucyl aminopeptidase
MMQDMNLAGGDSIPLWLLYEHEVEAWRATLAAPLARWLALQNFKGEKHRVVLLPDSDGALSAAVGGLGRRQGELSLWHAAGFVERLPPRRFRLAQQFSAEEATQLYLGFAYGGYRFDRYRPTKSGHAKSEAASIEAPPNADVQFVALAAES